MTLTMLFNLLLVVVGIVSPTTSMDAIEIYPTTAIVSQVNYEEDIVQVKDFNDQLWEFKGCEDWNKNDICSMIMCDMGTPQIADDVILLVRYSGFIE